jgi:hypothetical protein
MDGTIFKKRDHGQDERSDRVNNTFNKGVNFKTGMVNSAIEEKYLKHLI